MGKVLTKKTKKSSAEDMQLPTWRKLYFKPANIILSIVILLFAIFFIRIAAWEHGYIKRMTGSERQEPINNSANIEGDDEVDRTEPTEKEIAEYIVAADRPRYFSVPRLGINNARIIEVGLKNNGEMATPYSIYDIGWYDQSVLPGEKGVSIMDGHGGAIGVGILGNLSGRNYQDPSIKVGDLIRVEMGDGRVFEYHVSDVAVKANGDEANNYMTTAFQSPKRGTASLSIITCTGTYWLSSRTYSHRLFVRATLD